MKYIYLLSLLVVLSACSRATKGKTTKVLKTEKIAMKTEDIYQFKMIDLYGKGFDFSSLKGKKVMLVNTASKCGYTPQYKDLEKLYKTYKDKGFVIVGFPANNFGKQEPGTDGEIAAFCEQNYGVSFPMMTKTSVKGEGMNPVYKFLTKKSKNGFELESKLYRLEMNDRKVASSQLHDDDNIFDPAVNTNRPKTLEEARKMSEPMFN